MNKKYVILLGFSFLLIAIDQLTKIYIHTHYQLGETTAVIPGLFNITYVRNFGAAFGFLAESHPAFRELFFLAMPPVALIVILLILRSVADNDRLQIFALSSVFGGAIGNYIDRLRFRYVIDFLDFHIQDKYTWPAFNIADSAIVCGVGLLLVLMLFEKKEKSDIEDKVSEAKA
jgi:signal peptidase II